MFTFQNSALQNNVLQIAFYEKANRSAIKIKGSAFPLHPCPCRSRVSETGRGRGVHPLSVGQRMQGSFIWRLQATVAGGLGEQRSPNWVRPSFRPNANPSFAKATAWHAGDTLRLIYASLRFGVPGKGGLNPIAGRSGWRLARCRWWCSLGRRR